MSNDDRSAVEARLRQALSAVAETQPAPDDWSAVVAREATLGPDLGTGDPSRSRRTLLLVAAVVLVLAAVGSVIALTRGDDGQSVRTVDLTDAAEVSRSSTARGEITQVVKGAGSSSYEGEFDFQAGRARLRGEVTEPVPEIPDEMFDEMPPEIRDQMRQTMQVFANAEELILIGDHGYIRSDGTWWDLGDGVTEGGGEGELDFLAADTILEQVAELGQVRRVGEEDVRGAPATRFSAPDDRTGDRYDVWVDQEGRVVRVAIDFDDPQIGEPERTTLELYDFGTSVSIEAPADAQLLVTQPDVDVTTEQVAAGEDHGVSWRLSTGTTGDGQPCVHVDTDPGLDGEVVQYSPDGMSAGTTEVPAGTFVQPSCGPAGGAEFGGSGATLLTVGGRDGDVHYLAGLLDEGAKVDVTFHDGRVERLEGHDGAFVLFFTGDDWPRLMSGGNVTCELQGDDTVSGADSVC